MGADGILTRRRLSLARSRGGFPWGLSEDRQFAPPAGTTPPLTTTADSKPPKREATRLAVSPKGDLAATTSYDKPGVELWDLETGKPAGEFRDATEQSAGPAGPEGSAVAFSADGRTLAEAMQKSVRLWDLKSQTNVRRFEPAPENVTALALSPDGRRVAVATAGAGEISIASQPLHGTLTYDSSTGLAVYSPVAGFSGVDTFTYFVTDAQGNKSRTATVSVNVGFLALQPTAVDDNGSVALGSSAAIDVLANDSSPDGTLVPSSVTIVAQPQFGVVSVNPATGAVTYTPGGAFQLSDSFQYDVKDSHGMTSNVATVTIARLSGAPTATDDFATTAKNQAVSIDILANDQQGAPDIPLDPTKVSIVTATRNGSINVDPSSGAVTYTPKPNFFGTDSFTYTVTDVAGNVSNAAVVSITVSSSGFPQALDHEFVLVPGFQTIRGISALDNPTNSGPLVVQLVQQAALGAVALNPDGTFRYNQGPNFVGLDAFTYQVNDGSQVSNVGVIRLVSPQFHYVEKLYQSILGRQGGDADVLNWVGDMSRGASRQDVANAFLNSNEYRGNLVNSIYQQLLGRPADFGGTSFWVGQMQLGLRAEQVMAAIAGSGEYFARHGSTNAGLVAGLYQDLLGRAAGQAEIANWTSALAGGTTASDIAMQFLASNEYRGNLINSYYQAYLGHPADRGGLNNWLFLFQLGYPRTATQAGILASNEYFNDL